MQKAPNISKIFLQPNIQLYRKIVQYLFLATVVSIGVEFTVFVSQLANGILPTVNRVPSVSMSLKS